MDSSQFSLERDASARSPVPPERGDRRAAALSECVSRLTALTQRYEEFLARQLTRLDGLCRNMAQLNLRRSETEQLYRELRQQQAQWEQNQQKHAERIAEEVDLLSQSWDRIEAERRTAAAPVSSRAAEEPVLASVETPPAVPLDQDQTFDFDQLATGRSAALQFQQIKREIRRHARRHPN